MAKHLTLDFRSGHDPSILEIKPHIRLCTDSREPAWDSLPLPLSLSLPALCSHALCLSNKHLEIKKAIEWSECRCCWSRLLCAIRSFLKDCGPVGVLTFKKDSDRLRCVQVGVTWNGRDLDITAPGEHLEPLGLFQYNKEKNEQDWTVAFKYLESWPGR